MNEPFLDLIASLVAGIDGVDGTHTLLSFLGKCTHLLFHLVLIYTPCSNTLYVFALGPFLFVFPLSYTRIGVALTHDA